MYFMYEKLHETKMKNVPKLFTIILITTRILEIVTKRFICLNFQCNSEYHATVVSTVLTVVVR